MKLSKDTVGVLVDLIENKLAMMQIGDRNDLRDVLTLQRCLSELNGIMGGASAPDHESAMIPRRGRHRKLATLVEEMDTRQRA